MERQEPQGEENGDPLAGLAHLNRSIASSTSASVTSIPPAAPTASSASTPGILQNANPSPGVNANSTRDPMHFSPMELQHRLARPIASSPRAPPMTALDAHNTFPSLPRSLHEELLNQQLHKRGLGHHSPMAGPGGPGGGLGPPGPPAGYMAGSGGGLSPMIVPSSAPSSSSITAVAASAPDAASVLSKLTPSVYSHPSVQGKEQGNKDLEVSKCSNTYRLKTSISRSVAYVLERCYFGPILRIIKLHGTSTALEFSVKTKNKNKSMFLFFFSRSRAENQFGFSTAVRRSQN